MKPERLKNYSKKALAEMAKKKGIRGWHAMRKDQLVRALSANQRSRTRAASPSRRRKTTTPTRSNSKKRLASVPPFEIRSVAKDLSRKTSNELPKGYGKDRVVIMVRDPYWLHAYWELTPAAIGRAETALGQEWHTAQPILRLVALSGEEATSAAETHVRDVEIHGGVNNWYIDVYDPPRSYRVDIGYRSRKGRFFVLARSNVVTTPRAGVSDVVDDNWADVAEQYQKIYAMSGGHDPTSSLELRQLFEERLKQPIGSAGVTSFGSGAMGHHRERRFWFQVDAELIVYGATQPGARVTLQGEPVQLRRDGTFTMRFCLPDSRQIIPAVASSPDGVEERTIVLAVERNTKELEPMIHDGYE